ncbi:MAG TPA: hypothetical protein VMM36_14405 [Opitutaceae bacterium]|nr:hypothetical protein [Opitutaceae bacterium]
MEIPVAVVGTEGFDPNFHVAIIKLAISYTLALAFVFTVIITCLSMLGWVRFADPKQQKRLFVAVVVQLAVGSVGVFFDFLKINPAEVKEQIQAPIVEQRDAVEAEKQEVARELESSKATLADLRLQQESLEEEIAAGAVRLAALEADRGRLTEEVAAASSTRDALKAERDALEESVRKSEEEFAELEKKRAKAIADLAAAEDALKTAKVQLASETSRANDLQTKVTVQAQELATVKVKYTDAIKEMPVSVRNRFLSTRGGG